jgi:hypothetical protein
MKLFAENKGWVSLDSRHLMASVGEGSVYGSDRAAYKVYHEKRNLADKIRMLQGFDHAGIIHPRGVLLDSKNEFVGYWMDRHVGEPLPNLFANAWRQSNNFGIKETIQTVIGMREVVAFAHSRGALLVDANEFNWLAEGATPWVLDIDSWQVGQHKATALMPSIRDWSATTFTEGSDWFAWGVVTFQLFTGIHPYKGTHPKFGRGELEARMRANASVFDTGVRLNSAVRDITGIPSNLRDWYRAVFKDGLRMPPPGALQAVPTPTRRTTYVGDTSVTVTRLYRERPTSVPFPTVTMVHDRLLRLGGRPFAVVNDSDRGLVELTENGLIKRQWPVIANATTFFRTAALSRYFGQPYLLTVADAVSIFPAPFLREQKVIDIFADGGEFALVLALDQATGLAYRYLARLIVGQWQTVDRIETEESFINAAGTGTGIVAHIPESGELRVYSSKTFSEKVVRSPAVKAGMVLEAFEGVIAFFDGGEGYRLQLAPG